MIQLAKDIKPSKEMLMVAALIKNRVEYVKKAKVGTAEAKAAVNSYGTATYLGVISHPMQFGSYKKDLYNTLFENTTRKMGVRYRRTYCPRSSHYSRLIITQETFVN